MKKYFILLFLVCLFVSTVVCEEFTGEITSEHYSGQILTSLTLTDCTINFGSATNFQIGDDAVVTINGTVTANSYRTGSALFNLLGNATFTGSGKIVSAAGQVIINDMQNTSHRTNRKLTISGITIESQENGQTITSIGTCIELKNGAKIISASTTSSVVQMRYGATFSMEAGCSLDGAETALVLYDGGSANITGGTIRGKSYGVRFSNANNNTSVNSLAMTGGSVSGEVYGISYGKAGATSFAYGTVTLGGSATVGEGNIHIGNNKKITIQDGWTGTAGVTCATEPTSNSPVTVTEDGENIASVKTTSSNYPKFTKQLYLGTPTASGGYGTNADYGIRMKSDGTIQIYTLNTAN